MPGDTIYVVIHFRGCTRSSSARLRADVFSKPENMSTTNLLPTDNISSCKTSKGNRVAT